MFGNKVAILTILSLFGGFTICESFIFGYDYENNDYIERCVTKSNKPGVCTEFIKCNYAEKLYRSKRSSEITLCKMVGRIPFVCCPSYPPRFPISPIAIKIVKKSTKFQNALCKNVQHYEKLDEHIINGEKAAVGEFPFQVAIGYKSKNGKVWEFNCGGSLIADDVVLTAAHCVNKKEARPVFVRMGRVSFLSFYKILKSLLIRFFIS